MLNPHNVLLASLPSVLAPPPDLLADAGPAAAAHAASLLAFRADCARKRRLHRQEYEIPRPRQGGERISEEYLLSLPSAECNWQFRLSAQEIIELVDVLELPPEITTRSRHCFTDIEAFALTLARFRSPGDLYELTTKFARSEAAISEVVNYITCFVDDRWAYLLHFDHDGVLAPANLERYAEAIHRAGAPLSGVCGFIDCTIRRIARPTWYQRQAYNGYKKYHALKFQAVMLPNGMFGHLHGPVEGRRNDLGLLDDSGLVDLLREHAVREGTDENTRPADRFLQLFGDPAYGLNYHIISPFAKANRTDDELHWNEAMSAVRTNVENGFALVLKEWPFLYSWWKMSLYSSPVGIYYRFGVLMMNARNCMRPNQVAITFDCRPPSLTEYFHAP